MSTSKPIILILGASGQVGRSFRKLIPDKFSAIFAERNPKNSTDLICDIGNFSQLQETIIKVKPNIIINCAAYTAVDLAEKETSLANKLNAEAVAVMAKMVHDLNSILIHYSTDYVFDGSGNNPWKESDFTKPINAYGQSKLGGERAVLNECPRSGYVFRTQWVYDNEGKNFLNTMLRFGAEREVMSVVGDQIGAPTSSDVIATYTLKALDKILQREMSPGIYNLVCSGETSWHGFAEKIFELAKNHEVDLKVSQVKKIESKDFPTPAVRPKNSRLDLQKLQSAIGESMPHWEESLKIILKQRFKK